MKLLAVKFRCCVPLPQHPLGSTSNLHDTFASPDYAIETRGDAWLRITHVQSGKARLYPTALSMGGDEAPQEQQGQPQHGRKR